MRKKTFSVLIGILLSTQILIIGLNFPGSVACGQQLKSPTNSQEVFLGQGAMSGEVTSSSALVQTRLTSAATLNEHGDLPGMAGVVRFEWSEQEDFRQSQVTPFAKALPEHDFIVRANLKSLKSGTRYFYRPIFGTDESNVRKGPACSFTTHPGRQSEEQVKFIVGSCMNYNKFLHGREGNASGPLTATEEDKRLGFPAFEAMCDLKVDFFVGTGDIVYYDNPYRRSETLEELRLCWHEQFRFPRMIDFFQQVPTYWSKDDHDFRFNDSDNSSDRLPLSKTGIDLFTEQLPIVGDDVSDRLTYRTHRVSKHVQIWLTEGRDFRSDNAIPDGPEKTMWGSAQLEWLKRTLKASDAKWKILISPTPLVGPDSAKKSDNHTSLKGFRYEADAFFDWLQQNDIENFITICGDRHWQYHSIHPSGFDEFACGALNDENAVIGFAPGNPKGTDPNGLIKQPYKSPELRGGFLLVTAGAELVFELKNTQGKTIYVSRKK